MPVHPTAIVSEAATIGKNVEIGPYAVIEDHCIIGDGCMIDAHVKIARYTTVGAGSRIYFGAFIGAEPQDHRFKPGIVSFTEIGPGAVLREYVTIHRSPFENAKTVVGAQTLLMAFVHIGHDASIGSNVTIANNTAVSGHVVIEDRAVLSGYVLIHQFCRIGALAMIGGRTIITQDIPPYCLLAENCRVAGPNTIGLRRAGVSAENRAAIRRAVKTYFFHNLNGHNALEEILSVPPTAEVRHFVEFIRATERGVMAGDAEHFHNVEEDDNI